MRVEQRRSRSDFVATKPPRTEAQVRRARNPRNVGYIGGGDIKNIPRTRTSRSTLSAVAFLGAGFFGCLSAPAQGQNTPTNVTVTNASNAAVYANLTLGQPPTVPPANCTNLGQQLQSIADPRLVFTSSITHQNISLTPQTPGATELGYYQLAAGETIIYEPQTFQCSTGICSPAVTFNFLFTPNVYNGSPNNGCGGSAVFPNSSTIGEASINFGINGSVGSGCARRMLPTSAPSMASTRASGLWRPAGRGTRRARRRTAGLARTPTYRVSMAGQPPIARIALAFRTQPLVAPRRTPRRFQ